LKMEWKTCKNVIGSQTDIGEAAQKIPPGIPGKYGHSIMDMPIDPQIAQSVEKDWNLLVPPHYTEKDLLELLGQEINHLIRQDFPRLLSILYRVDVPEASLRKTLRENPHTDAGAIIARMILERQKEKQKLRARFKAGSADTDEERW
jgi:hypothetical protein